MMQLFTVVLKLSLIIFEKGFDWGVFQVISIDICPSKYLSRFNDFFKSFLNETEFSDWIKFVFIQLLNNFMKLWSHLVSMLVGNNVVLVSIIKEHVLSQLILSIFLLSQSRLIFACLWFFLILVALVVSTSFLVMVFPSPKTEPTELKTAFCTCHVVTSLVFLNWFSTFWIWTWFSVCNHPSNILRLIAILLFPFLRNLAFTRSMRCSRTSETKSHSADTSDIPYSKISSLNAVAASCSWTPFDTFIVISKRLTMKFHVILIRGIKSLKDFSPNRMRHFHWTFKLRTVALKTYFSHDHPLTQIVSPTIHTKSMPASHSQLCRSNCIAN